MTEGPHWIGVIASMVCGLFCLWAAASPRLWTGMDLRSAGMIARGRMAAGAGVAICVFVGLDLLLR